MVDATVSKTVGSKGRAGSSPAPGTPRGVTTSIALMKRGFTLPLAVVALGLSVSAPGQLFGIGKKPSPASQIKLGQQAAQDLRKKEKVLPSSDPRVRLLRRVGQRLLRTIDDDEPWEFTFDVIESKEVNAFALPGGATFFYTGLLDRLKTEDELAGVLGHELTHVRREHWARRYAKQQSQDLALSALLILGRANSDVSNGVSVLNSLYGMQFSRGDENDADIRGFEMMTRAGYNPEGMADVFRMLGSLGGKQPEFLSDHPSDAHRVDRIEDLIRKSGKNYPPQTPLRI